MSRLGRLLLSVWTLALLLTAPARAAGDNVHVSRGAAEVVAGRITVSSAGARLTFPGGLTLDAAAGTQLSYFGTDSVWLGAEGKRQAHLFYVERGGLHGNITGDAALPAVFRTQQKLVSVLRSGTLGMFVEREAVFANQGGDASIGRRDGWVRLGLGEVLKKVEGESFVAVGHLLKPPEVEEQRRIWSGITGPAAVGGLRWSEVVGGTAYDVRVTSGTAVVYEARVSVPRLGPHAFQARAGVYQLRVRSVDEYGFVGEYSEPYEFRVVGFVSGTDTFLDESGVVQVGTDQIATFSNTSGLEMTYGTAGAWIDAPTQLFFRRDEKTIVRFRYPGAEGIVAVPVAQQRVRARVRIGPKTAIWPRDDVEILVRLEDSGDGQAAAKIRPRIVVMLGVERVFVRFRREGNVLRGILPRQSGEGPWVVRAVVTHPSGKELGRDLLEIVADPKRPHIALR